MFKKILLPTDGYGLEDHAIRYAADVFPFAEFHVISVVDNKIRGIQLTTLLHDMLDESAVKAVDHAEKVFEEEGIDIKHKMVLHGIPSKEIVKYANENDVGLIVMRSYCRHGLQSMYLGSTIENVLKRTKLPILILSAPASGKAPQKILLASDGTSGSKDAENNAIFIAKAFSAEVTALYVKRKGNVRDNAHAEKVLKNIKWKGEHVGIKVRTKMIEGEAAESILNESNKHDMVIMGAGRKSFFRRIVMGHVSREACAASVVPVLLARGH